VARSWTRLIRSSPPSVNSTHRLTSFANVRLPPKDSHTRSVVSSCAVQWINLNTPFPRISCNGGQPVITHVWVPVPLYVTHPCPQHCPTRARHYWCVYPYDCDNGGSRHPAFDLRQFFPYLRPNLADRWCSGQFSTVCTRSCEPYATPP